MFRLADSNNQKFHPMKTSKSSYKMLYALIIAVCIFSANIAIFAQDKALVETKESQDKTTPADALQKMKDGNQRFVESKMLSRDLTEQVHATAKGQYPYAVVLGCIDSRVAPEITFDQGIGDIFDARIAGNFENDDISENNINRFIEFLKLYPVDLMVGIMKDIKSNYINVYNKAIENEEFVELYFESYSMIRG